MFLRLRSEEKAHILKFCAAFESAGLHSRNTVMDRMLTTKKLAAIVVLRRRVYCLHFEPSAHLRIAISSNTIRSQFFFHQLRDLSLNNNDSVSDVAAPGPCHEF